MPDVYLGLSLDVYLTLKLVYPGSCRPKQLILGRLLEKTIPWPILAQWRPSSVIHSRKALEKWWTPSCIGEILIQKHNQSPEPYGIQRFNKIDAMNLIFANFDTAKHPILAQNMPFWAFKSLPTDPPRTTPALKDLQKMLPLTKKKIPFRSQNKTSKKKRAGTKFCK